MHEYSVTTNMLRKPSITKLLVSDSQFNQTPDLDISLHPKRLRWIGDALMGYLVSLRVFGRYRHAMSDGLTKFRSDIVSSSALSYFYDVAGFEILNLNLRAEKAKEKVVEAFIGAVMIVEGSSYAIAIVNEVFSSALNENQDDSQDLESDFILDLLEERN